jgi:membrane protease YdiL (CAAX protease family)
MNDSEPTADAPDKTWPDRLQALFEVILLSGLISNFAASLPFSALRTKSAEPLLSDVRIVLGFILLEAGITFLLLAMVLKAHRETLYDLGLRWKEWRPNLVIGAAIVPFLFLVNAAVSSAFRIYLPKHFMERNPLTEIIHTPQQLGLFIFAALVAGGVKEELQRAFILTRFRRHLGGAMVGLIVWSISFGAGHYIQGLQGIVIAIIFGFVFGIVYLARGNLIAPMVAHGVYDTLVLLAYWHSGGLIK